MDRKKRNESGCRNIKSKDGTFGPRLNKTVSERLTKFCKETNRNRTEFVIECINNQLDILEKEYYESLTREELIDKLLKQKG